MDAVRWYLATQGPLGSTDADFAHANFVEVYNAELANGLGNCASRVVNMIHKYFDGVLPEARDATVHAGIDWPSLTAGHVEKAVACISKTDLHGAGHQGLAIVTAIDGYINTTEPFRLAKRIEGPDDPAHADLALILFNCAEALRISAMLMMSFMPSKAAAVLEMLGADVPGEGGLAKHAQWRGQHGLKPGAPVVKGPGLFMRAEADEPAPTA